MNPISYEARYIINSWDVTRWQANQGQLIKCFRGWHAELRARRLAMLLQRESDLAYLVRNFAQEPNVMRIK